MRIFFSVCISMVQAVHNGVCLRAHVRGALCDVSKDKEEAFPAFAHAKGAVRGIPVLEEGL